MIQRWLKRFMPAECEPCSTVRDNKMQKQIAAGSTAHLPWYFCNKFCSMSIIVFTTSVLMLALVMTRGDKTLIYLLNTYIILCSYVYTVFTLLAKLLVGECYLCRCKSEWICWHCVISLDCNRRALLVPKGNKITCVGLKPLSIFYVKSIEQLITPHHSVWADCL